MNIRHPFFGPIIRRCESKNEILHVYNEVDPYLEMSHIHLEERRGRNRIIVYHKIKNCRYKAISNLFGDAERAMDFMDPAFTKLKSLTKLMASPMTVLKKFHEALKLLPYVYHAIPQKGKIKKAGFEEVQITDLPLITHWEKDGGAFVTLPQVYSEDPVKPGIWNSNVGMYRIQLTGNEYEMNKEIGLHYQLHRGIGIHHTRAKQLKTKFKVSVFVGGPPAHTFSAVMPLPEGMPEICMAGFLSRRRFRYDYLDGWLVSLDADFVILGEVDLENNKPEGPFGDHFGYYSLVHPFPYMKVHKVLAKPDGIWPFTVVGRPPQEDTIFGHLIHELTSDALLKELPGVNSIYAVDAAGVHPLLLALGSERYTPYLSESRPAELITQSLRILGTGQLSLAKFLLIMENHDGAPHPFETKKFFKAFLERLDEHYSLHFITRTTIDTLDYTGGELNRGSKVIMAATAPVKRKLFASDIQKVRNETGLEVLEPLEGIWMVIFKHFTNYEIRQKEIQQLRDKLKSYTGPLPVILVLIDEMPVGDLWQNFLWITFTRCNPEADIHAMEESFEKKTWKCRFPLIIDASIKPHHAPILEENQNLIQKIKYFIANEI
ncbi:MAG: UbiD family decarboxylase [Bacteroidia bacterium]|nr:UbiD family decarboxylase [Bacteroidia bacterium]